MSSSTPISGLNPINGNNFINATETSGGIALAGQFVAPALGGKPAPISFGGSTVTIKLNGKSYRVTTGSNGSWSLNLGSADLSALVDGQTYAIVATVVGPGGVTVSATQNVTVDRSASINISAIDGNGIINAANVSQGITVRGTSNDSVLSSLIGQSVNVSLNGKSYGGTIQADGSWSVSIGTADLSSLSSGQTYAITASVTDKAGNSASHAATIKAITTAPVLSALTNETVQATGPNGAAVTFSATATDVVDGTDPVVFSEGTKVVHSGDTFALGRHTITASATDSGGNTSAESFTVTVVNASPSVAINAINGNDVLNAAEAASGLTVTGTSGNVVGQVVTLALNGANYAGQVGGDGTWSITVPAAALAPSVLSDGSYVVTADVTAPGGAAAPTAQRTLVVHETLPTLAINPIDGNDVLNASEAQQQLIIGGVSTGAVGRTVTVALDGQTYRGQIGSDGTWSVSVPSAALGSSVLPDGKYAVTADVTDQYGNVASEASRTLTVHETLPATPVFDLSSTDQTGTAGSHQTQFQNVTLVGHTDAGDTVTLNGANRTTVADTAGKFEFANVSLSLGDNALTVTATNAGGASSFSLDVHRQAPPASPDAAIVWNGITQQAIANDASVPEFAARALAMESLAVFDAVSAINGSKGYLLNDTASSDANANVAVAQAAHDVLVYLYPGQEGAFDALLAQSLAAEPDGQGKIDGIALGSAVASQIIALRANDGWNNVVLDEGSSTPGQWRPTPPGYMPAQGGQYGSVTPFAMTSASQFLPAAPPALDSADYAAAVNETKSLGSATSTTRTADQTQIAKFWNDGAGTYTPPGQWNSIADQVAEAQADGLATDARILAELNVAEADAAIAAWNAKYAYN